MVAYFRCIHLLYSMGLLFLFQGPILSRRYTERSQGEANKLLKYALQPQKKNAGKWNYRPLSINSATFFLSLLSLSSFFFLVTDARTSERKKKLKKREEKKREKREREREALARDSPGVTFCF